jgi:hypothetical protein
MYLSPVFIHLNLQRSTIAGSREVKIYFFDHHSFILSNRKLSSVNLSFFSFDKADFDLSYFSCRSLDCPNLFVMLTWGRAGGFFLHSVSVMNLSLKRYLYREQCEIFARLRRAISEETTDFLYRRPHLKR